MCCSLLPHWCSEKLLSLTGTNNHTITNLTSCHWIQDFYFHVSAFLFFPPFLSGLLFNLIKQPHILSCFSSFWQGFSFLPLYKSTLKYVFFTFIPAFIPPSLCVVYITFNFKTCPLTLIILSSATTFASIYLSSVSSFLHCPTFEILKKISLFSFSSTADQEDYLGTMDSSSWTYTKSCPATCWPHLALHTRDVLGWK